MAIVDVVVVAYQSRRTIGACVRAARDIPGVGHVLVVDHGDDGAAAVAAREGAIAIRKPANPGFATGQNLGIRKTEAPFVVLLNPDAIIEVNSVAAGLQYLEDHPAVAAVQGVVRRPDTGAVERSAGAAIGPRHLVGRLLRLRRALASTPVRAVVARIPSLADHVNRWPRDALEVEWLAATALVVRRSALEAVGGFDERYFLYGEDADLCRRLRAQGWRLVALPQTWATHQGAASSGSAFDADLRYWAGTLQYASQWWSRSEWAMGLAAAVLRTVGIALRRPTRLKDGISRLLVEPVRHRRRTRSNRALSQPREKRA